MGATSKGIAALGALALTAMICGAGSPSVHAKQMQQPTAPLQQQQQTHPATALPDSTPNPERARDEADRVRALNESRHKKMLEDSDKLLALSTELKAEVEKSGKDELSLQVVKKAVEIEKLAHDIQVRMRQ
jgi:hypothetical protein